MNPTEVTAFYAAEDARRQEALKIIRDGSNKITVIMRNGVKETIRVFRMDETVYRYKKGSAHRGYQFSFYDVVKVLPVLTRKSKNQKWADGWKKVKSRLQKSGLWEEIVKDIDIALDVGFETVVAAYRFTLENPAEIQHLPYEEREKIKNAAFKEKFPKLTMASGCTNASIIWYMNVIPKVKKMRFDKQTCHNDFILSQIKNAMDKKMEYRTSGVCQYDISFSYKPDEKKAWYSEEFRGCGNGHYYLALDETHALFYEDD